MDKLFLRRLQYQTTQIWIISNDLDWIRKVCYSVQNSCVTLARNLKKFEFAHASESTGAELSFSRSYL